VSERHEYSDQGDYENNEAEQPGFSTWRFHGFSPFRRPILKTAIHMALRRRKCKAAYTLRRRIDQ
jgi:hypothetical protein